MAIRRPIISDIVCSEGASRTCTSTRHAALIRPGSRSGHSDVLRALSVAT